MTAVAIATQDPPKPAGIRRILPMHVKGVEYVSRDMSAMIEPGTTLDEVLHPEFWTHTEGRLREWGIIHCRWMDKTRYVMLMVVECSRTWAKTKVILDVEFEPPAVDPTVKEDAPELTGYKIGHIPNQGFRVIHKETNNIIVHSLSSRSEAETFLARYIEDMKKN